MKAQWIWNSKKRSNIHEIIWFRYNFNASQFQKPVLKIAADTDFIVWINGIEAGRNQYQAYPEARFYQLFDIADLLHSGDNEIKVQVYHAGESFFTYCKGDAGLWVEITDGDRVICVSNAGWEAAEDPFHNRKYVRKMTSQLGFCFETNLNCRAKFKYAPVVVFNDPAPVGLRPVKNLVKSAVAPAFVVSQGEIIRPRNAVSIGDDFIRRIAPGKFFNECTIDYPAEVCFPLSFSVKKGAYILVDLEKETAGLLSLDIKSSAAVTLDIANGEHISEGLVRAELGARYFVDRVILRKGENIFEQPFRIIGARYLELHFYGNADIEIRHVSLAPVSYPLEEAARFKCDDSVLEKLDDISIRTMQLCMHNHYEDCPWREQGLYAYDSRNQALYGYNVWGNYDYVRASFNLMSARNADTGWLNLCSPTDIPITIPVFSFAWLGALADYKMYSGMDDLHQDNHEKIDRMFAVYMKLFDEASGLLKLPQDGHLWHFYEWVRGIDAADEIYNPQLGAPDEMHALFNLYFLEILRNYAEEKNDDALRFKAENLASAIHRNFWDENENYYHTANCGGKHFHVQIMALYCNIVPADKVEILTEKIVKNEFGEITFEPMAFMIRGLMPLSEKCRKFIYDFMCKNFRPVIESDATALWEIPMKPYHIHDATSLCHAWASVPAYYFRGWMLGIRPLKPGFAEFSVNPYPADMHELSGEIMTPAGIIHACYQVKEDGIYGRIKYPAALKPEIISYPEFPVKNIEFEKY